MYTSKENTVVSLWPILSHPEEDISNLDTKIRKISSHKKCMKSGINKLYTGIKIGIHNQLVLICIQELEAIIKGRVET